MASVSDYFTGTRVPSKSSVIPAKAPRKPKAPKYTQDDAVHDERQFQAMIRKPTDG